MTTAVLAAVLTSLAFVALQSSRQSASRALEPMRNAVVARELDRLVSLPFASLPASAGCETPRSPLPHTRCITISQLSHRVTRVTLVIAPLDPVVGADTVVIDRGDPARNPLSAR